MYVYAYTLKCTCSPYLHKYIYAHICNAHTHTHTWTHKHLYTVLLYSQESQNTFEGYLVEARESNTRGDFAESSSIWGTWLQYQSSPYHALHCNRSSTSQDGPYPVSTDNSTNIAACRGGAITAWASLHIVYCLMTIFPRISKHICVPCDDLGSSCRSRVQSIPVLKHPNYLTDLQRDAYDCNFKMGNAVTSSQDCQCKYILDQ